MENTLPVGLKNEDRGLTLTEKVYSVPEVARILELVEEIRRFEDEIVVFDYKSIRDGWMKMLPELLKYDPLFRDKIEYMNNMMRTLKRDREGILSARE